MQIDLQFYHQYLAAQKIARHQMNLHVNYLKLLSLGLYYIMNLR